MEVVRTLASESAITMANSEFWVSVALALLLGALCWAIGTWTARRVGLLERGAPAGETLGVGLGSGLLIAAASWAAIWSGARSSFTPVAVGFAIAMLLTITHRLPIRRPLQAGRTTQLDPVVSQPSQSFGSSTTKPPARYRTVAVAVLSAALLVATIALLYGATLVPGPRDGVQPAEKRDEAFYAVLGRDLADSGTETNLSPSGFSQIPGAPVQIWYHWGEMWLASAVITFFGSSALAARYFVVLPLLVLAAVALSGTVVRRMARTDSRSSFLLGAAACLFLAPVPLIPGPFFSAWAVGMSAEITTYGLGTIAALMALYCLTILAERRSTLPLAAFVGSAVASILPAHIAIAVLSLVGVSAVGIVRFLATTLMTKRLPAIPHVWRRPLVASVCAVLATLAWGILTGHQFAVGGGSVSNVSPFNASWRDSVAIVAFGGGAYLAIPVALLLRHGPAAPVGDVMLGTIAILVAGAIGWGSRLGSFTMFYLFFGGIAVFATPIATVAILTLRERLRATNHLRLAAGLVILFLMQLQLGFDRVMIRLNGPSDYAAISVDLMAAIRRLPEDARLAYSCHPFDEVAFGTPQLVGIDAHSGRRVVPMCFEAEFPDTLNGAARSEQVPSQFYSGAPQAELYPDAEAAPSPAEVSSFMRRHGINFIYADARHPNSLVPEAVLIAAGGGAEILRLP